MYFLYDLAVHFSWVLLQFTAVFNSKIRQFVQGRKGVISYLKTHRDHTRPLIWMHTASLGEFEQGLPVLKRLHAAFPDHQILITFFSPSGYEVKKTSLDPHLVTYLPIDTRRNAKQFLRTAKPDIALFVKYEVWPQFFRELQQEGVPILLLSALFRPRQAYFKWYGGFLRNTLKRISHFYVQDQPSKELLASIGFRQVEISGDTRFDRVLEILESPRELGFMERFRGSRTCLVTGSSWPEDHEIMIPWIENMGGACLVIAPHKVDTKTLENLESNLKKKAVRYSETETVDPEDYDILIIDTIGLLTQIYRYADIAYVGGGFATGLHNTLEPAVYGIPVLIGPDYHDFREAEDLVREGGIQVVENSQEFQNRVTQLLQSREERRRMGNINTAYIHENKGASEKILDGVQRLLR